MLRRNSTYHLGTYLNSWRRSPRSHSRPAYFWLPTPIITLLPTLACLAVAIGSEPERDLERLSESGRIVDYFTLPDGKRVVDVDLSHEWDELTRESVQELREHRNLRRLFIGCAIDDDARRNLDVTASSTRIRRLPFGTPFTDEFVTIIAEFRELELLDLSGTAVTDKGLIALIRLPRLYGLGLSGTTVTGSGLLALKQLPALGTIDLRNTRFDEGGLDALSQLPKLRVLMISGETIEDHLVVEISKKLPQLRVLRLQMSKVSDDGLRHLAMMRELEELRLNGSKAITETGLTHLVNLKGLKRLDLEDTGVRDDVINALQAMPNLEYVRLTFTRVSQRAVDRLRAARPKLKVDWTPGQRVPEVRSPELTSAD